MRVFVVKINYLADIIVNISAVNSNDAIHQARMMNTHEIKNHSSFALIEDETDLPTIEEVIT